MQSDPVTSSSDTFFLLLRKRRKKKQLSFWPECCEFQRQDPRALLSQAGAMISIFLWSSQKWQLMLEVVIMPFEMEGESTDQIPKHVWHHSIRTDMSGQLTKREEHQEYSWCRDLFSWAHKPPRQASVSCYQAGTSSATKSCDGEQAHVLRWGQGLYTVCEPWECEAYYPGYCWTWLVCQECS